MIFKREKTKTFYYIFLKLVYDLFDMVVRWLYYMYFKLQPSKDTLIYSSVSLSEKKNRK